ncbi:TKL protein kinase [Saprolegnia diclina VS20]|uniref:TKL protein kinase n=1 Tax=Saprolegnia diclina (strain VS20) TaxID=1156394 RepID=T0RHX0_SAPDV|nr:TKL protein kinase [Saprolegnia diclina VS20]EQC31903.1 TKL protein kinase [Saprolegnia diclina VS20]|eukprot:XP_008614631.1 TKL protein kinase [Saprolegnia diclina VS20]
MIAAGRGPIELVHLFLNRSANVNLHSETGTALGAAAHGGNEDIVRVLLDAKADVHRSDDLRKVSPLLTAADNGSVAVASELLARGANLSDVDKNGFGVVAYAAQKGHVAMIRFLVNEKGADPNATSFSGNSPLLVACFRGKIESVKALLETGAKVNDPAADPCLIAAAANNHLEIVAILLQYGMTALYAAVVHGHANMVRQLTYARAMLDKPANDGTTPLLAAQALGNADVLAVLQDVRAKKMVLLHAARQGNVDVVQALLSEGLSVNETDEHGNALVHLALLGSDARLLAELLKDSAVELSLVNAFGESPEAIAVKLGHPLLVRQLHVALAANIAQVSAVSTVHLRELGRGSYGIVFKGSLQGQDVAIKELWNPHVGAASLRAEMQILIDNPSPYLVRLVAPTAESDAPQLFFQYMDGGNLTSYLEKLAKDKECHVTYTPIEILWVVANALNDLHAKDVVHRDIKTDNILLSSKHYIKVGDVGIAKEVTAYMTTGAGTSKWRAPEVLTSGSSYGKPADIYSFGILLETLYPNPTDASTEWAQALAAECTDVDPTRRPKAAKLVDNLLPILKAHVNRFASMRAFEADRAAGHQAIETTPTPPRVPRAEQHLAPFVPRVGRIVAPFSREEAFQEAVRAGDDEAVVSFLKNGVHPDSAGETKETPLMQAVEHGHYKVVDRLLEFGADVNNATTVGLTVLHTAAHSSSAMLEKLLRVANVNVSPRDITQRTPLHVAISNGHTDNVDALIRAGADIEAANDGWNRPLHIAAYFGYDPIVQLLLRAHASTTARNQSGETVLYAAISHGHGVVANTLVHAGVDINAVSNGQSPLHCACRFGVADVIPSLLAKGADVNVKHNGVSPLYMSIIDGHWDVVTALVASPNIDLNERDENGCTILHIATTKGCLDVVRAMIQAGVDVDVQDDLMGLRAIDVAALHKNDAMVKLLLPAHYHKLNLLQAIRCRDVKALADLLRRPYSCNVYDEVGCSLVHLVVRARSEVMLDLLLTDPRIALETRNQVGKTPLAMAIECGCISMAKKLFDCVHRAAVEVTSAEYDVTSTELGHGSFGVVHLGSYLGEQVAVKTTRHLASFKAEARVFVACPSPFIVQLRAIADADSEAPALLLEYMNGGTLRNYLDKKALNERTPMNLSSLQVAWVVISALRDLHAKHLLHRDIKSQNVLLNTSGEIKLGDLGLARLEATDKTEAPGTRLWMAPEILQANGMVYSFPADIYAFGVLLTELDTCQLPYFDQDVQDPIAFVRGVINGSLRPTLTTKCEPWLRQLAEMCLDGNPEARPTADLIVEILSAEMAAVPPPDMSVAEMYLRAVAQDSVGTVAQLLTHGVPLDWTLPGGASLLLAATTARAIEAVTLLLERGAYVNDDSGGRTPLHEATENVDKPEIMCAECGNWHAVDAVCSCGHDASPTDRMVAVVRRLMRLHHRGYPVDWMRKCISTNCHQSPMTVVDTICPKCGTEARKSMTELKMLHIRLKMAMNPAVERSKSRRITRDEQAIPRSILRWLARFHAAEPDTSRPQPSPSVIDANQYSNEQGALVRDAVFLETLASRAASTRHRGSGMMPWASASAVGRGVVARILYARTSDPVLEMLVDNLPAIGVAAMHRGHNVVHRHVGNGDDLEAIAKCTSPFIVQLVATARPQSVLVQDSLSKSLRDVQAAPHARAKMQAAGFMQLQIIYVIANALADIHAHGLVHGHLSSHNVFFSPTMFFQVGVPGTSATDDALLAWTAPEVLAGDSPPSPASDVYAFGILMTELDTFQLPFADYDFDDEVALAVAVVDGGLRPTLRDDCDVWYRNLVGLCVDADPLNRPTAAYLVELLQELLDDTICTV